jgi:arsenite-transporting ATPase
MMWGAARSVYGAVAICTGTARAWYHELHAGSSLCECGHSSLALRDVAWRLHAPPPPLSSLPPLPPPPATTQTSALDPSLRNVVDSSLRWIFVGGKGGVGKTTTSCALGIALAAVKENVLIVSTDPAHNLSDAFDQRFSSKPMLVAGFTNLSCMEVDGKVDADTLAEAGASAAEAAGMGGMLGNLTSSIPGWDEVMAFMAIMKTAQSSTYSTVVFDTAPTGHTLRLLAMPGVRVVLHALRLSLPSAGAASPLCPPCAQPRAGGGGP